MNHKIISVFAALCLVSQVSLAMETPEKLIIAGSVLAAVGLGGGIAATYFLANNSDQSSQEWKGELAGTVIGWAVCAGGVALLGTGLVKKYCAGIPPSHEPIIKNPGSVPPQTAPDGSIIIPIDG